MKRWPRGGMRVEEKLNAEFDDGVDVDEVKEKDSKSE